MKKYFCDICKKETKSVTMFFIGESLFSDNAQDRIIEFPNVCKECTKRVVDFIKAIVSK